MAAKKTLQEYAVLAEIASAIAIVGSSIFVGLQVRHSSLNRNRDGHAS